MFARNWFMCVVWIGSKDACLSGGDREWSQWARHKLLMQETQVQSTTPHSHLSITGSGPWARSSPRAPSDMDPKNEKEKTDILSTWKELPHLHSVKRSSVITCYCHRYVLVCVMPFVNILFQSRTLVTELVLCDAMWFHCNFYNFIITTGFHCIHTLHIYITSHAYIVHNFSPQGCLNFYNTLTFP